MPHTPSLTPTQTVLAAADAVEQTHGAVMEEGAKGSFAAGVAAAKECLAGLPLERAKFDATAALKGAISSRDEAELKSAVAQGDAVGGGFEDVAVLSEGKSVLAVEIRLRLEREAVQMLREAIDGRESGERNIGTLGVYDCKPNALCTVLGAYSRSVPSQPWSYIVHAKYQGCFFRDPVCVCHHLLVRITQCSCNFNPH